ncbi:mitochondrial K+-H+ exchange-related-domain-containing protein [Epithele typhae]|uniref:mitochondrial K+-H+ exchange-related-domain-containing protein n=1 Tax=Epithele typhae TaxID=378194 RepID=UPI002008D3D8|nr:mitochondrial K+-H+ exchange-related-domain-containing protein [Epithele typhae]KAH9925363.1 mitochondrial K+-H+ exchange-related-domain-containing protein [Epithele typhae]
MVAATRVARAGTRALRIVALPLTPASSAREQLTYYHFVTPPDTRATNSWLPWITTKATDLWAGLGKAPEGNWKRRAFLYGERLVDRLEFEELALKSVDPSIGPKLSDYVPHRKEKVDKAKEKVDEGAPASAAVTVSDQSSPSIPLVYPPSACSTPVPHLEALLAKRAPRHRKGFWFWLAVAPLTAPFAIIPIIPNFPFFFCVWRSWHHYRAYKASDYLSAFLRQGAIVPQTSTALDVVYAKHAPRRIPTAAEDDRPPPGARESETELLLTPEAVPELEKALELPDGSSFTADVLRALEQARLREAGAKT